MNTRNDLVILLDVDNTLLDNDRFAADLGARLEQGFGADGRDRYWALYTELRDQFGYADYLAALQAFGGSVEDHPDLLRMSEFLLEYPFVERLYPRALETVSHLRRFGLPVVLSDGDIVYQPRKVQRSGIWDAVEGRVLIQLHKQRVLDVVRQRFPAAHYLMVDDKPQILAAMKQILGVKLTTIFVRQGHYAIDSENLKVNPAPDLSIERISDLIDIDRSHFVAP